MWTPYNRLYYYAFAQEARNNPTWTARQVNERAAKVAQLMAEAAMPTGRIAPVNWPVIQKSVLPGDVRFSQNLIRFVMQRQHTSRTALEKLILAHSANGESFRSTVERSYQEYSSIGYHAAPLAFEDVLNFAQFFWNWSTGTPSDRIRYASLHLVDETDLYDIFLGTQSLLNVQVALSITEGFDFGAEIGRMAAINILTAKRAAQALHKIDEGEIIKNASAFKDIASFTHAAITAAKISKDMGDHSERGASLEEYVANKYAELDDVAQDYRSFEAATSPDDLYEENRLIGAGESDHEKVSAETASEA